MPKGMRYLYSSAKQSSPLRKVSDKFRGKKKPEKKRKTSGSYRAKY